MDGEVYRTFILATNDLNEGLPRLHGRELLGHIQPAGEPPQPRPDGWTRERYLKTYLMEMVRCMKEGVPIEGYLYWDARGRRAAAAARPVLVRLRTPLGSSTRTGSAAVRPISAA